MAGTPLRPIRYQFVFGKGRVKTRRDSANPTQFVVREVLIRYAEDTWNTAKKELQDSITSDVRAELIHVAGQFRRYVIGAPGAQRGVVGRIGFKAKGGTDETQTLGQLPRWAPRDAAYLRRKSDGSGNTNWFDNSDWTGGSWVPPNAGLLSQFFGSKTAGTDGGGTVHVGSGGIFEELFGGVTVQIQRNNTGSGADVPEVSVDGRTGHMSLGSIRVRALGRITENMLRISDSPNRELLSAIASYSSQGSLVALHLRGGRGRYRPALEPYLRFFLEQSIPHAVHQRLAKGTSSGRLFRSSSRG